MKSSKITIERFDLMSKKSFDQVLLELDKGIGRPIAQHELHVGAKRFDGLFEHLMIVCKQGVLGKRGERFSNVVTEIDRMAAL